ncbi:hypothetical protein CA13_19810 [Planctomycetes bacterium CA13]|uniref:Uncharacterized protein n=1 Tax=Novipirellula herctigrandis TaxID=2527986 RepID=A0A5C5Z0K3_9BACT|nr:hypothetical protein CA13_19810 [Planctomycetes bacterium CA13]
MHNRQNVHVLAIDPKYDEERKTLDGTDPSIFENQCKLLRVAFNPIDRNSYLINQIISKASYQSRASARSCFAGSVK